VLVIGLPAKILDELGKAGSKSRRGAWPRHELSIHEILGWADACPAP
jgi:hypothetical protein